MNIDFQKSGCFGTFQFIISTFMQEYNGNPYKFVGYLETNNKFVGKWLLIKSDNNFIFDTTNVISSVNTSFNKTFEFTLSEDKKSFSGLYMKDIEKGDYNAI